MRKSRFTEERIVGILQACAASMVCRRRRCKSGSLGTGAWGSPSSTGSGIWS